jgi:putative methyltransferase (TIGR04325 family)
VWIRHHRYLDRLLTRLVGYRRTFPTFQQAEVYASHFQFVGHQHPDNIAHHSAEANQLRESDYPALFHLAPVAAELRRVFDLGGSVGNLFYSLSRELKFSHDLDWVVYDLPPMRKAGSSLAEARHEYRLRFTDTLAAASGSDLFLASGCLHYFEKPLEEILASLEELARRVLINRTPCARRAGADDEDVITIQDNYSLLCSEHHSQRHRADRIAEEAGVPPAIVMARSRAVFVASALSGSFISLLLGFLSCPRTPGCPAGCSPATRCSFVHD